jgi:hypothetical protein
MVKETAGDVVVRYVITIGAAIVIMGIFLIALPVFNIQYGFLMKWVLYPLIAYCVSLGFNALLQKVQCDKVTIGLSAKVAVLTPIAVIASLLVNYIPFVLYPIRAAMVGFSDNVIQITGTAFVLFWASYFAQIVEATFTTVC